MARSWVTSLPGVCLSATLSCSAAALPPATADLVLSEKAAPALRFGAEEIRRSLVAREGLKVRLASTPSSARLRIYLGQQGDEILSRVGSGHPAASPESYSISLPSTGTVVVEGSDAAGAMYGALDLAEQILFAKGDDFTSQLKPARRSPFLALRGVNMFLTTQDIDEPEGAFWSDAYWMGYLGMMARNRYNLLDIHGPCDAVTLSFPNGFSYFVSLPDFPQIGVGAERARKNMTRFHQVIQMAADRGIKVAYMNYEAPAPIGPWKTGKYGQDERWTPLDSKFLEGPALEEYTRQAVTVFLKQLPELWMFGFRVGESGQPEDFFKKTYLAALKDVPSSLNLYARTWIADSGKIRELAKSTPHRLFIEPKYNGEQLGSPYQAVLGGREYPASGSYEDYTNYPRNYSILWQIRAHGTHRVFFWGSPEFARRTVRSCKFGDGVGFSMEPMEAYCPARDYLHNNPKVNHGYRWMFERQWLWHMVWGRTAYDPDLPEEVFIQEFVRRFGAKAGPKMYRAVVESSKIIPFIYSYHTVGLDHQEFAPEFETGDHILDSNFVQQWTGDRFVPFGGDNETFLKVLPIDRTAMSDPVTYVDLRLKQTPSGKMTPWAAADYLDTAAEAGNREIQEAAALSASSPEFDCLRRDVEALAALARYYGDRIRSVTHLEFYHRTYHHAELAAAYQDLQHSIQHWDQLAEIADGHFGFVPDTIRMGVNRFRWREEGRSLGVDLDDINRLELEYARLPQTLRYRAVIGHVPPAKAKPGRDLSLSASLTLMRTSSQNPSGLSLFYRNGREMDFKEIPMQLTNSFVRTWTVTIPGESIVPGRLEYYFETQPSRWAHYTNTLERQPAYSVLVNDNDSRPEVTHRVPDSGVKGDSVTLEIDVHSASSPQSAYVYYKRMPAHHGWVKSEMQSSTSTQFQVKVPLTHEGILYYFEVCDENGNAVNYPNFLKQTPYFAISGWDPARSARQ